MTIVNNSTLIEAISEMAEKVTHLKFGDSALIEEENQDMRYTEEAQDFFNNVYDSIETMLSDEFNIVTDLN